MAERGVYQQGFQEVAIPQDTGETRATIGAIGAVTNTVVNIAQKHEDLKMANLASQADLEMMKTTEGLQKKYALDPTSEKGRLEAKTEYDKILNKYDDQIGFMSKGQWGQIKEKLKLSYSEQNIKWSMKQTQENAQRDINDFVKNSHDKSYALGLKGDAQDAVASFELRKQKMAEMFDGLLPADEIAEHMKNFTADALTSYIMGVTARDPEQALKEVNGKTAQQYLSAEQTAKLKQVIFTTEKKNSLKLQEEQFLAHSAFDEQVKDLPFHDQLKMLEAGKGTKYTKEWAETKEKALLSTKGVDAETQTEKYAELLQKKADIEMMFRSPSYSTSGKEIKEKAEFKEEKASRFLRDSNAFLVELNIAEANGEIKSKDAQRLQKSLIENTSKATANVGIKDKWFTFEQYDANKMFKKSLSSDKQALAIREYFDATDGQKFTEAQKKKIAQDILDNHSEAKRKEVLGSLFAGSTAKAKPTIPQFKTVAEARSAGLKKGEKFLDDKGVERTWK